MGATMDEVWPIISNKAAIAVNQAWAGHSGSPFKGASRMITVDQHYALTGNDTQKLEATAVPSWQYFYKPLGNSKVAVLMMNHDGHDQTLALEFADVPDVSCTSCSVYDIWRQSMQPTASRTSITLDIARHDSAFLVLMPAKASDSSDDTLIL